jgi:hypothetical protein
MVEVSNWVGYLVLFGIAVGMGALGGVTCELLRRRSPTPVAGLPAPVPMPAPFGSVPLNGGYGTNGSNGSTEDGVDHTAPDAAPRPHRQRRFADLGVWQGVLVGAVAAVAALWLFPPQQMVPVGPEAALPGVRYDVIRLIVLSLLLGWAASGVLGALQSRTAAIEAARHADVAARIALQQLDVLAGQVDQRMSPERLRGELELTRASLAAMHTGMQDGVQYTRR